MAKEPKQIVVFQFRCTAEEAAAFTAAAASVGLARIAWIRQLCRNAVGLDSMKVAEKGKVTK